MNNPLKFSHILLAAVMLCSSCEQEEDAKPVASADANVSVNAIASRLNAIQLDASKLTEASPDKARALADEIIKFDDGGVCAIQDVLDLPGCTSGVFYDPTFPYFYTLNKAYFFAHHSLGPGGGLAAAGDQYYFVFGLSDPNVNHKLTMVGSYWVKYSMKASSGSKTVYFDLRSFNLQGSNITFWFLKNGVWYWWSSLAAATHNVSSYTKGISEFQIRCTGNSVLYQAQLDDIVVNNVVEK